MHCSQAVKSRMFHVSCWAWATESDGFNTKELIIVIGHSNYFFCQQFFIQTAKKQKKNFLHKVTSNWTSNQTSMFLSADTNSVIHQLNLSFKSKTYIYPVTYSTVPKRIKWQYFTLKTIENAFSQTLSEIVCWLWHNSQNVFVHIFWLIR